MNKIERKTVLLVESKRSTYTEHVLKRKDLNVIILIIVSKNNPKDDSHCIDYDVPVFYLNENNNINNEVEKYNEWSNLLTVIPEYFCNPNESMQYIAQEFARLINLPCLTKYQVDVVRNKIIMKEFYNKQGISCAKYKKISNKKDIIDFACEHGYPVIIKPVDSDSCINTYKINVANKIPEMNSSYSWMVEEYIDADEYQICAIISEGRVIDAFIAKNPAPIIEVFDGAMNANITLAPSEKKPIDAVSLMQKISSALDLNRGYLHGEFFINKSGEFHMSEIAARLSGCEAPLNHSYAYGFDFLKVIMDTYTCKSTEIIYSNDKSVGDLLLPAKKGKVIAISSHELLMQQKGVIFCRLNFKVGDYITPLRASGFCSGYVQVEGSDSAEVENRMSHILDIFSLEVE